MLILTGFLLAQLHLDSLMNKTAEYEIRSTLKRLPTGSEAYDQAYEEAMERIEQEVESLLSRFCCGSLALDGL